MAIIGTLDVFRIGQCLTSQGSSDRPSGNSQYDSCRIHHLNFANCRGSFFAKYWRCIMARLTIEDLRADHLLSLDFEHLNSMGVDASEVWGFICRVLDFCDDEHFNSKVKSMFSMYVSGYFACYNKFNLESIKHVFS